MSDKSQDPRAEKQEDLQPDRRHENRLFDRGGDVPRTHIKQACDHMADTANKSGSQNGNGKNK